MTLPFVVAQYINCADYWWVWPCWFSSFGKVVLMWGVVAVVVAGVLGRTLARAK